MSKVMSERQRYWHEHLQRANEQRLPLAQYAREQGLALKQLYGAKTWLVKLGHWPRAAVAASRAETRMREFVTVRMTPPLVCGARAAIACKRLEYGLRSMAAGGVVA